MEKKVPPQIFWHTCFHFLKFENRESWSKMDQKQFWKSYTKVFFQKTPKNHVFSFLHIFVYFIGSRRQLSKGKSFLQKSEKLFQREWRLKMALFAEKICFLQDEMHKFKCRFQKHEKKHFFLQLLCRVYLKQLNQKVTRKKRVFCCFFPTFFRFSLVHSILKLLFLVFIWCSDMTTY